jgi:hypothetical protein
VRRYEHERRHLRWSDFVHHRKTIHLRHQQGMASLEPPGVVRALLRGPSLGSRLCRGRGLRPSLFPARFCGVIRSVIAGAYDAEHNEAILEFSVDLTLKFTEDRFRARSTSFRSLTDIVIDPRARSVHPK